MDSIEIKFEHLMKNIDTNGLRSYGMPEVDEDDLEAELDALGEDFALDEDTSYLDDAISAPSVPSRWVLTIYLKKIILKQITQSESGSLARRP